MRSGRVEPPHGFADDAVARALVRRPPASSLRWVEGHLGATVVGVRAARGGRSSAVHLVRVVAPSGRRTVVLRRYVVADVLDDDPGLVEREAATLPLLGLVAMATPELLAVDAAATECDVPALLMSRVPGRIDWAPADLDVWLDHLVALLPVVHTAPIGLRDGVPRFRPYRPPTWDPPVWLRDTTLWDRALEVFHGPRLDPEDAFVHRDLHPGNVLWRRGRVSGLVDWQAASIGPRAVDVLHCRTNLSRRFGHEVAARFAAMWAERTGGAIHPWTEVVMLVDALHWGMPSSPSAEHLRGAEALLARALASL